MAALYCIRLKKAFEEENLLQILKISSDIGHYVGDAHVPLHTTKNYNGQLTGQKGIHGFWESRLPELFSENYDLFTGKATYLENAQLTVWKAVETAHLALDTVLSFEKILSKKIRADKQYVVTQRGQSNVKTHSLSLHYSHRPYF